MVNRDSGNTNVYIALSERDLSCESRQRHKQAQWVTPTTHQTTTLPHAANRTALRHRLGGHPRGGDGSDNLWGLGGDDLLKGGAGDDALSGGEGADTLLGGIDDDTFEGGEGGDYIDGGQGDEDAVVYSGSDAGVSVDLATGVGSGGDAEGDTLIGIEDALGSDHNDTLYGTDHGTILFGLAGDDWLEAGPETTISSERTGTTPCWGVPTTTTSRAVPGQICFAVVMVMTTMWTTGSRTRG